MKNECRCSPTAILEDRVISNCTDVAAEAASIDFATRGPYSHFVVSHQGKLGVGIRVAGLHQGDSHNRLAIAFPSTLGVIVSTVEANEPRLEETVQIKFKTNVRHYVDGRPVLTIAAGEVAISGRLHEPATLRIRVTPDREQRGLGLVQYDWKCLAKCAPQCMTCLEEIGCWLICAGACVAVCAFP
jgi:hypothetical protein